MSLQSKSATYHQVLHLAHSPSSQQETLFTQHSLPPCPIRGTRQRHDTLGFRFIRQLREYVFQLQLVYQALRDTDVRTPAEAQPVTGIKETRNDYTEVPLGHQLLGYVDVTKITPMDAFKRGYDTPAGCRIVKIASFATDQYAWYES